MNNMTVASRMRFEWTIDEGMSALDASLAYLRSGAQPVILHGIEDGRCTCGKPHEEKTNGKHPVLRSWQKDLVRDEVTLRDQLARINVQSPNVGLVLGGQANGEYLVAIDIDNLERFDHLTGDFGPLPPSPRCDSGRGYRLFFRLPVGIPIDRLRNRTGIGGQEGVDAKVAGGQVVVAPSKHFLGGRYAWVQETLGALAELPMPWVDALISEPLPPPFVREYTPETIRTNDRAKRKLEKYLEKAVIEECSRLARMPEGQRNTYLHTKAVSLLSLVNGCFLPQRWGYVLSELSKAAQAAGLDQREVRKTLASAENYVTREGTARVPRPVVDAPVLPSGEGQEAAPPALETPRISPDELPFSIDLVQYRGNPAPIAENIARLLLKHPMWQGGPRLDLFGIETKWPMPLPTALERADGDANCTEVDVSPVQAWMIEEFKINAGPKVVEMGIYVAASRQSFDSLIEYVEKLPPHDGIARLDTWLTVYFGAPDTPVTRRIGRAWLASALARAIHPGCVADGMLILEGLEGTGKNWGIEQLFGAKLVGQFGGYEIGKATEVDRFASQFWVLHDDELRCFSHAKKNAVFSWLTRKADTYRIPYARDIKRNVPRRAVLVGSKNPPYEYFEDGENRRFWPVRTGVINIDAIERDREQLLAEALVVAKKKIPAEWTITKFDPLWQDISDERQERVIEDPMVSSVLLVLPADAHAVTTRWVMEQLSIPPERHKSSEQSVSKAIRELGFERQRAPRTVPGRPWVYVRVTQDRQDRSQVHDRSQVQNRPGTAIYV